MEIKGFIAYLTRFQYFITVKPPQLRNLFHVKKLKVYNLNTIHRYAEACEFFLTIKLFNVKTADGLKWHTTIINRNWKEAFGKLIVFHILNTTIFLKLNNILKKAYKKHIKHFLQVKTQLRLVLMLKISNDVSFMNFGWAVEIAQR